AESTSERSSIAEPRYLRNFDLIEQVDQDTFNSSSLVTVQKTTLKRIEFLYKDLDKNSFWNKPGAPNSLVVKFTPVNPGFCGLFVNNNLFYDVYLMARRTRHHYSLESFAPVVQLTKDSFEDFEAFDDHFRYLWSLDVTMDCQDATRFDPRRPRSLARVNAPQNVSFQFKAGRILGRNRTLDQGLADKWMSQARRILNKFCTDLSVTPELETVFVTCSWKRTADENYEPNFVAKAISRWLSDDFTFRKPPALSVQILEAIQSEFFTQQLYRSLSNCTIGLVVLSCDIEAESGEFYSRPNIYHELGFLMNRLGKERIIVLKEKGVQVPSNISNVVYIEYEPEKVALAYHRIVDALARIFPISRPAVRDSFVQHQDRVIDLAADGVLNTKEKNAAVKRLKKFVDEKLPSL
ncbi:MAG: TIR domain-containing protein, partial [Acidobacteriota bacterium]